MRSFRLLIALIVSGTIAIDIPAAAAPTSYVPGEILVKFKSGTPAEKVRQAVARMKTSVKRKTSFIGVRVLSLPPDLSVEEAVASYQADPDVQYAEPNYVRRAFVLPNDPTFDSNNPAIAPDDQSFFKRQWNLHNTGQNLSGTNNGFGQPLAGVDDADIDAPEAWDIFQSEGRDPGMTPNGTPLIVAMIDSGVDYTHPDLSPNMWANPVDNTVNNTDEDQNGYKDDIRGWNFSRKYSCDVTCNCHSSGLPENNDPMDDNGHGTHVAGIAAARGNNGVGIAGVLWTAQILPLKILDANGCGSTADEIQAIDYAINNGAKIINASFGGPDLSLSEEDAIRAANNAGIVFVAAAGNESSDNDKHPIYPASFDLPNVISVAASDLNDRLSPFSNSGKNRVDIAAPGDCIYSTTPQGLFALQGKISCHSTPITSDYAYISGTSMATPHVSGVAGLLLSQDPSLTPEEVRAIILFTVDPREGLKGRVVSAGRLNASGALRRIKGSGLIGGGGGCGFPIAMIRTADREGVPPTQGLIFILGMFWPLLIPMIRKNLHRRRPSQILLNRRIGAASSALLVLMVLWPPTAAAVEETPSFQPVHSLGLKIGYHRYDHSEYLDANSGLVSRGNLAGLSEELEYDWRWREDDSLSVTAGRYHSRTDLKNVCCDNLEFSTNYLLFTPKHYSSIKKWVEWYIGGGIGYYDFTREIHGLFDDHLSARLLGIHAVTGLDWPVLPRISIFTEARYALAKVKHADVFGDALDVGGLNYSFGLSWRFSPADPRKSPAD